MIARLAPLVALAALVAACEEDTIVLARIPGANDDGGGTNTPPVRCATIDDCGAGSFCDKASCDDAAGTCQPLPVDCPDDHSPVCGCDRIMYFNDCLRRASGIASNTGAQCDLGEPLPCGGASPCPNGAMCALFYDPLPGVPADQCPPTPSGVCWVIPQHCSTTPQGPNRFDVCGGGPQCVDSCNAIASGQPFRRAHFGDCPSP